VSCGCATRRAAADEALILDSQLRTLEHLQAQLEGVDERIAALAQEAPYAQGVARLMSLRGIGRYSAMVLLSEIGDIQRFASAPQLMSYLGLVPSESSSGEKRRLGSITKAGKSRARWVLAQAAWNQTRSLRGERLHQHWQRQPLEVVAILLRFQPAHIRMTDRRRTRLQPLRLSSPNGRRPNNPQGSLVTTRRTNLTSPSISVCP